MNSLNLKIRVVIKDLKFPFIVYSAWQGLTWLFLFFQPAPITSWFTNWDSSHYIDIATKGYQYPQQAFFPLWPILIKTFSWVISAQSASFVLTLLFGFSIFALFYLLAEKLTGKENAKYSLILFASFPSMMFLHSAYTEGLFLTLTLLSFLLLEHNKYFLSSIVAGFAGATRVIGVGISISFLLIKKPLKIKLLLFLISLTGLFSYMLFLQINYQDSLLFLTAQNEWCPTTGRCGLVFPLLPIGYFMQKFLLTGISPENIHLFWDLLFSIVFLSLLIPVYKKLGWRYLSYSAFVLLVPLASGSITSMVRFVLVAFPVFLVFPQIVKNRVILLTICLLLFLLQLCFAYLFINNNWVA